ncbi:hypothetical protein GF325_17080 [Candidatus Bathyarchaeota archaeon]|nr:hypothetical protein [Candidatus Bathyarchaeota archaeon]
MVDYKQIPPSPKWHKKVQKLADDYNKAVRKNKTSKIEKTIVNIEDGIIKEKDVRIRRDYAFLVQLIEERHGETIFPVEILELQDYLLGGRTGDDQLVFKELGEGDTPRQGAAQGTQHAKEQFDIETIDLSRIELLNLEVIKPKDLEKSTQKCAFGDGQILLDDGTSVGKIWRCKACGTVYHENCLRVCLLTKGCCMICDAGYIK